MAQTQEKLTEYIDRNLKELRPHLASFKKELNLKKPYLTYIVADIQYICLHLMNIDNEMSDERFALLIEVLNHIKPGIIPIKEFKAGEINSEDYRFKNIRKYKENEKDVEDLIPEFVKHLEKQGAGVGDALNQAKELYWRIAHDVFYATKDVNEELFDRFTKVLFPTKTTEELKTGKKVRKGIDQEALDKVMEKMNKYIGLEEVKNEVNELINFLKIQKMREENDMKVIGATRHLVFTGNPGTGKTSIARMLAEIFAALGILSKGHLTETDRSGLVAGYVGQTALKVNKVVQSALGGILFIDEAYALAGTGGKDFGQEAVDTLIKLMEDNKDDLVVIVAGYTGPMKDFISSNPGLRSRFNKYINFKDYTVQELLDIFKLFVRLDQFKIADKKVEARVKEIIENQHAHKDETFGNARMCRNLFDEIIRNQANRLVKLKSVDKKKLETIRVSDIPSPEEFASGTKVE